MVLQRAAYKIFDGIPNGEINRYIVFFFENQKVNYVLLRTSVTWVYISVIKA